jgi:glucuronate isomerase
MRQFLGADFLLKNETAKKLYKTTEDLPIFDFHNHLSAEEIYRDRQYANLTELWLGGDHYKWRLMRTNGILEADITGKDTDPYKKFTYWADTVANAIGNPLYHWTHLELQRYFGITTPLAPSTAEEVWKQSVELLKKPEFSVRNLLKKQNVTALCTTDDPIDDLKYHILLQEDRSFLIKVLPTFRPDRAINIEKDNFLDYLTLLGKSSDIAIDSLTSLKEALKARLEYFIKAGCLVSDHSLECNLYEAFTEEEVQKLFRKKLEGNELSSTECAKYRAYLLTYLGREYAKAGLVMQLHIGALRNNSSRMFGKVGADTGFDSMNDFAFAPQIAALLDSMDVTEQLPKTILYCINPKDMEMLACMSGNYQDGSCKGKVQFGAAWWFNDHIRGMEYQMEILSNVGLLSTFVGMLTDSRSFLSFPRHEYFRRILCNKLGTWVEDGEYPWDEEQLIKIVKDICFNNAVSYFRLSDR